MDRSGISALIQRLPNAERAQIGIAVLEYTLTGATTQEMSPALSLAFEMIKGLLSAKSSWGGRRSGSGRKSSFSSCNLKNLKNENLDFSAENRQKLVYTNAVKNAENANSIPPTPPLLSVTENNIQDNINNNITITRARENSVSDSKNTPAADLFSATAAAPTENQSKKSKFTPPTVEMVAEYCATRKNGIDPQHFVDHYTVRNWIPKGSTRQMTDWRVGVRTWERTGFNRKIPPDRPAGAAPPTLNPFAILDTPNGEK